MIKEVPSLSAIILAVAAFTAMATSSYQAPNLVSMQMSKSLEDPMEKNSDGGEADDELGDMMLPIDDRALVSNVQPGEDTESGLEKHMTDEQASAVPSIAQERMAASLPDMRIRFIIYYDSLFYKKFSSCPENKIRELMNETQLIFNYPSSWKSMELIIAKIYRIHNVSDPQTFMNTYNSTDDNEAEIFLYFSVYPRSSSYSVINSVEFKVCREERSLKQVLFAWETTTRGAAVRLARIVAKGMGMQRDPDNCNEINGIMQRNQRHYDKWTKCSADQFLKYYNETLQRDGDFCLNKGCKSAGKRCNEVPPGTCDQWYYKTYCQGACKCSCT